MQKTPREDWWPAHGHAQSASSNTTAQPATRVSSTSFCALRVYQLTELKKTPLDHWSFCGQPPRA
jgi:hypothetical protein